MSDCSKEAEGQNNKQPVHAHSFQDFDDGTSGQAEMSKSSGMAM